MKDYMTQFEKYSSLEAYEVAATAREKGLLLLEGTYNDNSYYPIYEDNPARGYCVVKVMAGQYLTLWHDGSVYQDHVFDGPCTYKAVKFYLTLEEARNLIMNFNGTITNHPNFFAYVRVYDGEPEYYGLLQRLCLEEFARKHGITYKERFMCIGGHENTVWHPDDSRGIDDILDCCEKSFSKMDEDSYLVVSDISRLNDNLYTWRQIFNIITVAYENLPLSYEDMGYTKYEYHESEELRKAIQDYEKSKEDREYERMCQEHRKIMMEQDEQLFIEEGEENE